MKTKILGALKTKYANLGFNQKALDGVASVLEKTITEEAQIDDAVANIEPMLKVFQADIDRMRTEHTTLKNQYDELLKRQSNGGGGDHTEPNDAEPAWFTAYKEQQEERYNALKSESDALKAEKAAKARRELIMSKAKELGIPQWRMDEGFVIADDADEAAIGNALASIQKNLVAAGLDKQGGFPLGNNGEVSKEEASSIVAGMKI